MKSHSGAKKRFRFTKSGKIKMKKAFARHILTKKSTKRMRKLRHSSYVHSTNEKAIRKILPFG